MPVYVHFKGAGGMHAWLMQQGCSARSARCELTYTYVADTQLCKTIQSLCAANIENENTFHTSRRSQPRNRWVGCGTCMLHAFLAVLAGMHASDKPSMARRQGATFLYRKHKAELCTSQNAMRLAQTHVQAMGVGLNDTIPSLQHRRLARTRQQLRIISRAP